VLCYLPVLSDVRIDPDHPDVKPRHIIKREVARFVLGVPNPELWAWYGAYDHVALAQIFGTMLDLPSDFPMWTNDVRQKVQELGNPRLPIQPEGGPTTGTAAAPPACPTTWSSRPSRRSPRPCWPGRSTPGCPARR
jgi:hypothetical protein